MMANIIARYCPETQMIWPFCNIIDRLYKNTDVLFLYILTKRNRQGKAIPFAQGKRTIYYLRFLWNVSLFIYDLVIPRAFSFM